MNRPAEYQAHPNTIAGAVFSFQHLTLWRIPFLHIQVPREAAVLVFSSFFHVQIMLNEVLGR